MVGPTTNHHEIRRWAEKHGALPIEVLPPADDVAPVQFKLKVMRADRGTSEGQVTSWEKFFNGFHSLGLVFIGSENGSGFNELLQVEEQSPFLPPPSYRLLSGLAGS